jgi:hypothetical protein
MDTTPDTWAAFGRYVENAVRTAVEATRLGYATEPDLTITITTTNIINAAQNPQFNPEITRPRHR